MYLFWGTPESWVFYHRGTGSKGVGFYRALNRSGLGRLILTAAVLFH